MKLNLGCGRDIKEGWVNVDYKAGKGIDIVADLSKPLPFQDASIDEILISNVLEHLYQWEATVIEMYRILKPGGKIEIRVPYGIRGFDTAFHVRFFSPVTMDGFCKDANNFGEIKSLETSLDFKKISIKVNRRFMYRWQLRKYLHIQINEPSWLDRYGRKDEIVWILEKP